LISLQEGEKEREMKKLIEIAFYCYSINDSFVHFANGRKKNQKKIFLLIYIFPNSNCIWHADHDLNSSSSSSSHRSMSKVKSNTEAEKIFFHLYGSFMFRLLMIFD
jgi:hypothetical protein